MSFSKKMLCGALVTALSIGALGVNSVEAADVRKGSFSLYYNSPTSGYTTDPVKLTVYKGTNYFKVSKLWGSAPAKIVSLKGANVKLSNSVKLTSVDTVGFTYTVKDKDDDMAVIKVKLNTPRSGTPYAKGKLYY